MQYKTIVLELVRQRPALHRQLRSARMLLPTLDSYAQALKNSHLDWQVLLRQARPGSDPIQLASEALELALQNLEECLPHGTLVDETETLSLDEAMATLRSHTPSA